MATARVYRRQGGSPGVYIIAGGIIVVCWSCCSALGLRGPAAGATGRRGGRGRGGAGRARRHDYATAPSFPTPPLDLPHYHGIGAASRRVRCWPGSRWPTDEHSKEVPVPDFLDSIKGFGVTFRQMFRKVDTVQYPEEKRADRAALPRPAPAQPVARRAGEVHRLRAVRLGLPGGRHLRGGRGQHRRGAVLARRAVRPRLPDQLPALHPVRAVHRGVPDAGADDDQRVRAGRRQPGEP